jgi:hypothetical protein
MAYNNQSGSGRSGQGLDDSGPDSAGQGGAGPGWSGLASRGGRGQPWFGPRQFGNGWGPRTWQGFLVTGLSVALVVGVGSATKGHGALFIGVIVLVVAVHLAIIAIQRRR